MSTTTGMDVATRRRLHRFAKFSTVALFLAYVVIGGVAALYCNIPISDTAGWLLLAEALAVIVALGTAPQKK